MPISFKCATTGKKLSVKDSLAGKKIKCPVCLTIHVVPVAQTTPAQKPPKEEEPIDQESLSKWAVVSSGLRRLVISFVIWQIFGLSILAFIFGFGFMENSENRFDYPFVTRTLIPLGGFCIGVMWLVLVPIGVVFYWSGLLRCAEAPDYAGIAEFASTALFVSVGAGLLLFPAGIGVGYYLEKQKFPIDGLGAFSLAVASLIASSLFRFTFLFYIRGVAACCESEWLRRLSTMYILAFIAMLVLRAALAIVVVLAGSSAYYVIPDAVLGVVDQVFFIVMIEAARRVLQKAVAETQPASSATGVVAPGASI